jgi:hypothetical protein
MDRKKIRGLIMVEKNIKGFHVQNLESGAGFMVISPLEKWRGAVEALCIRAQEEEIVPVAIVLERLNEPAQPSQEPSACFTLWGDK